MASRLSLIIPTKDRCELLKELLESIKRLKGLDRIQPEIIIGDNHSNDETWSMLQKEAAQFAVPFQALRVTRQGKSAVLNEAIRVAKGELLAFLDDDVLVDPGWLEAVVNFFQNSGYQAAQGTIRISSPESDDRQVMSLIERYRTVPKLEFGPQVREVHSLNGANMVIRRRAFDHIGCFDERLGPGASGTTDDAELALRMAEAGIKIGYVREAIVYHRVDPSRLTEEYFTSIHRRQGQGRALYKKPGFFRILFDLTHALAQYGIYYLIRNERKQYRGKGRVHHYLGMLEAKFKASSLRRLT